MYEVIIVGGGLSGLISSILLSREGIRVILVERKRYPFHKVCGEYVSNEATNFLKREKLYPTEFQLPQINKLQLTSTNGRSATLKLTSGGFGISRYFFDNFLFNIARKTGAEVRQGVNAENVVKTGEEWRLDLSDNSSITAKLIIGAFGKRSNLDRKLDRSFLKRKSPYLAAKYHIEYDHPEDQISLHNFDGGYCGMSKVENGVVNLCYMSRRDNLSSFKDLHEMEENVLFKNPHLKEIFSNAKFLIEKPVVINEISFETKNPVENGIFMTGDSAGMITPLCGNGMAMAIHSSKILSKLIKDHFKKSSFSISALEKEYIKIWRSHFSKRLFAGRKIQKLFGSEITSNFAVNLANNFKPVGNWLVNQTHGKPF